MPDRHLPVRPNLDQLRHQAKDLLRDVRRGDPASTARLADAQRALARSYGLPSWPRMVLACRLTDAIWRDDAAAVRDLVTRHPRLLHEDARGVQGNWGPPMSYAANLGRDQIITMLRGLGAEDVQFAFDRACLQSRLETAQHLFEMGARPAPDSVMGPCETLSGVGLEYLLNMGAQLDDGQGDRLAPVALILETYARNPEGKHHCLDVVARHGVDLPDTPPMAVHRGRLDLLERHLQRAPDLLGRTFSHQELYPPELGCHADESLALHGTPLAGGTLLHLCVDNDELELARWLLDRGADPNAPAAIDADGFGGHTALYVCVVSQPYRCGRQREPELARLLLERGASPYVRASLRKQLRFVEDEGLYEYRDVTPLEWGRRFHDQAWVSRPVMALLAELDAG